MNKQQILVQIDRLRQIVESSTPKPTPVVPDVKPTIIRDQHKAGKLAHNSVVDTIMLKAALLALASKGDIGKFLYAAKAPEKFQQTGLARVIDGNPEATKILVSWSSVKKENRRVIEKPISEWRALWAEYFAGMVDDHKTGKHVGFAGKIPVTEFVKKVLVERK